jgi:hypothetical protein
MILSGNTFTLAPLPSDPIGTYPVTITLFDGAMTAISSFNVIIVNNPPSYNPAPSNKVLNVGTSLIYQLFPSDVEGDAITTVMTSTPPLPGFITFASNTFTVTTIPWT